MTLRQPFALLLTMLLLAACSGPKSGTDDGESSPAPPDRTQPNRTQPADEREKREERSVSVAQYETFDVSSYPVRPPDQTVEVTHRAPSQLMQGRASEGAEQTLEGYRVQVFSAQDQEVSQKFREQVRRWWETVKDDAPDVFREQTPIVIKYSQPYYRVRIGAFADREAAEEALKFVSKKYEGAFVAQGTVTIVQ